MFQGLKVIGSAGSRDKCEWLKEVGFDHVFNYKERTVDEALKEFAPEGVDLYFDNVTNVFVTSSSHTHTLVTSAQYFDEPQTLTLTFFFNSSETNYFSLASVDAHIR